MAKLFLHDIFAQFKKTLPAPLTRSIRAGSTALLTPFYFSIRSGHFVSSLQSKAVDAQQAPLPWYTYPAIEFLSSRDFTGRHVLEFGAGQSTLWWAKHAAQVTSFEEDKGWYEQVKTRMPAHVDLTFCPDLRLHDFEQQIGAQRFDVVIVDGFDRLVAAQKARLVLKPDGILILDNSEGYWGAEGTYPIIDLLMSEGMMRVDFCGHSPANIMPSCTSIFFRAENWLFSQTNPPVVKT